MGESAPESGGLQGVAISGLVAGLLTVVATASATVGVPLLLLYLVASAGGIRFQRSDRGLALLIVAKLVWITTIFLLYDRRDLQAGTPLYNTSTPFGLFFPTAATDVFLLVFLGLKKREPTFLRPFAAPLFALLIADLSCNLYAVAFGADPFGRAIVQRPDDIIPRLGGVFGHPFQSINVSFVALILAWHFRRKLWLALAVLNIAINGSFRGTLTLAVLLVVYVVVRCRVRLGITFAILIAVAASVFTVTVVTVVQSDFAKSGNMLRVVAWENALEVISENPLVGYHQFQYGEYESVDVKTILDYGIAESTYLDYGMRFGLPPLLAHLAVVIWLFVRRFRLLRSGTPGDVRMNMTAAVLAGTIFVDTFYGSILGAVLPTVLFGFFCISTRTDVATVQSPTVSCAG